MNDDPAAMRVLESALARFECQTGTIHRLTGPGLLGLVCCAGVPAALLDKIRSIPVGKGIAGAAAELREPVELCNLQQDLGGVAKPDARKTGVAGSLAAPIFDPVSGGVIGTIGVGKSVPYQFTAEEKQDLAAIARELAVHFADKQFRGD